MFPPKKTKMKKAIAVLLSCTFLMGSIVPTYADDDAFEGWNSDTKEDAWTVYTTTEWATVQDQLLLGQASTSMKADVSRSVRNLESKDKDI